ncbi:hypothetical protein GCM10022198_12760 [Klugiella xanthotipulae]
MTVTVETRDCREISISWGVTRENMQRIADSFEPGATYEFKMKWVSIQAARGFPFVEPSAEKFRMYDSAE